MSSKPNIEAILLDYGGTLDSDGLNWIRRFHKIYIGLNIIIPLAQFYEFIRTIEADLIKQFNVKNFGFIDAFFPVSISSGMEFCDEIIRRGLNKKIRWVTETRVDMVSFDLLRRMREAGLHLIMYGYEAGNQRILDIIRKKTTINQALQATRDTKRAGINTLGLFILGMHGENRETCEQTIRFAKELDCDFAKFNLAIPFPGTGFYEMYKDKLKDQSFENFTSWQSWLFPSKEVIYAPEGMSPEELISLQRKAMFRFYLRPSLIFRHIFKRLTSFKNLLYGGWMLIKNYLKIF